MNMTDILFGVYSKVDEAISDLYRDNHVDEDWLDHDYEDAVFDMYAHVLGLLVKLKYDNMNELLSDVSDLDLKKIASNYVPEGEYDEEEE